MKNKTGLAEDKPASAFWEPNDEEACKYDFEGSTGLTEVVLSTELVLSKYFSASLLDGPFLFNASPANI